MKMRSGLIAGVVGASWLLLATAGAARAQDPAKVDAAHYKVVFETSKYGC